MDMKGFAEERHGRLGRSGTGRIPGRMAGGDPPGSPVLP